MCHAKDWGGSTTKPAARANAAIDNAKSYRIIDGLLHHRGFDKSANEVVWRVVVPDSAKGVRSYWYYGRRYNYSPRKMIVMLYHDNEIMGGHSSEAQTIDKIESLFWWPSLKSDVGQWCLNCPTCRLVKPQPVMSSETRTELHERPFKVLFIDTIGPIKPTSDGFS